MSSPDTASTISRRALAEFIGTALLVAAVIGSGIAAARLSPRDTGLQLLENAAATAAALTAIILAVGPVSGAHLNPSVTLADWRLGGISGADGLAYAAAQIGGVGAYIGGAYWFTSSTSFANPAVTIARTLSNTFAGIAPSSAGPFLAAQVAGTLLAIAAVRLLYPTIAEVAGTVVLPHTEPGGGAR